MNDTVRAAASPLHTGNSVMPRGGGRGRLADLAFGSLSLRADEVLTTEGLDRGRHLAFLPADALELDLGDVAQRQFGDYELLEQIGEGGMGVVYRARQISLDREVAVKLLSAGPWASRDFVERFQREAQNAARMQHPNIVTIHEVGAVDEMHFFSMRLIRGSSLAQTIREGPRLTPQRVAVLMRAIAEAVDYAHRLGVLHLDLKPANVLLDEAGEPHVADFGLARRLEAGTAADNTEVSGTPSYMAPEQATPGAQKITPATDIWGLGAILYELVTGKPPFAGTSAQATLKLVTEGQLRSPRRYVPDLPRDLEAIILKCMMHSVTDRYASARALAEDLTRFIEGREVRARPLNRVQRGWRWARREPKFAVSALLAVTALLAGLATTTQQWRRANANATAAQANAAQALANASEARSHAAESSERLWAGRRDSAVRLMQDGKGFEALVPLLANIEEQEQAGKVDPASIERREFGMVMHQGVTLIDRMILPEATPLATGLSPDGSLLAIGLSDMTVRWYETATLTERGRVDISGWPTSDGEDHLPRVLRFIDNHRLRVTLDWYGFLASPANNDTRIVDLDHSKVIDFPSQFEHAADATFTVDGRHALLRNTRGEFQLWASDPWKPLSGVMQQRGYAKWAAFLGRNARYLAVKEDDATRFLSLRDPRDMSRSKLVPLHAAVTAWAENKAGSLLAVGDSKGHLFLVDVATAGVRQLSAPSGPEVTWIAFSEDDAWLGAVQKSGAAFAFDVASSNSLVAGQMLNEFEPREIAISHRERLVAVAGHGDSTLWRVADDGPNVREATPVMTAPSPARAGTNSLAVSFEARLLATAGLDGEVRLWRTPKPVLIRTLVGVSWSANSLYFDGQHLPDVAYNHVRVLSTTGGPHGPWLALPQPVAYGQIIDAGKTLVAASGHQFYILDASTLQARLPPIELPANPMRIAIRDGFAVMAFGTNSPTGFQERLIAYSLETGAEIARALVRGPLRQFEFSADGARLLTVGSATGATEVFDAGTLERIGIYRHEEARPITSAAFVARSDVLWLIARDAQEDNATDADLFAWNARSGTLEERRRLPAPFPVGVTTVGGRPFLATQDRDLLDPGTEHEKIIARTIRGEATAAFAMSHDGRLLAHTVGWDVQIHDTATMSPVGPPLHSNMGSMAYPIKLAFSPDDSSLVGNEGSWVLWPLASDLRPVAELRTQMQLLNPAGGGEHLLQVPSTQERISLRGADPGPPVADSATPMPRVARYIDGFPILARDPAASPLLLDLTRTYTRSSELIGDYTSIKPGKLGAGFGGILRIDGVDYDARGAVEIRRTGRRNDSETPMRFQGIRVPATQIAAFHVLMYAPQAVPTSEVRDYAYLRVHYADGGSALLRIRTQREVPGSTSHDAPTPVGWFPSGILVMLGSSRQEFYSNPRLPNPHPEKLIAAIDLEAADEGFSEPMFFAVTAEPVIAAADNGKDKAGNPNAAPKPSLPP